MQITILFGMGESQPELPLIFCHSSLKTKGQAALKTKGQAALSVDKFYG